MSLEHENVELLNSLQDCQEDSKESEVTPKGLKKGSKGDLINEIFNLCHRANIPCEYTESQLRRMNKKKILEILATYCEKVVEKKIMEKCKIKENVDNLEQKQKTKLMNVSILRMAHDSLCYAAESLTHRFTPYTVEGMTHSMKENKEMSEQINQCLAEIALEYQIQDYIESPSSRLFLIWITAGVSNLKRKTVEKKNGDISKRVRFGPTKTTLTDRNVPVRGPQTRKECNVKQNTKSLTR